VEATLADWRHAPISPRLRATLTFLEKLTLNPNEVDVSDVIAARAAGISDQALREVIYVCCLLSTMDRLADAFGFPLISETKTGETKLGETKLRRAVRFLAPFGYRGMSG
jgi:hypothetical protein